MYCNLHLIIFFWLLKVLHGHIKHQSKEIQTVMQISISLYIYLCCCLLLCQLVCSLQTVASLSLLYDSLGASCDNAEFLIVMGGDPFISLLSVLASSCLPLHEEWSDRQVKADRQAIRKTDPKWGILANN